MARLSASRIRSRMKALPRWKVVGGTAIERVFEFKDFPCLPDSCNRYTNANRG